MQDKSFEKLFDPLKICISGLFVSVNKFKKVLPILLILGFLGLGPWEISRRNCLNNQGPFGGLYGLGLYVIAVIFLKNNSKNKIQYNL